MSQLHFMNSPNRIQFTYANKSQLAHHVDSSTYCSASLLCLTNTVHDACILKMKLKCELCSSGTHMHSIDVINSLSSFANFTPISTIPLPLYHDHCPRPPSDLHSWRRKGFLDRIRRRRLIGIMATLTHISS